MTNVIKPCDCRPTCNITSKEIKLQNCSKYWDIKFIHCVHNTNCYTTKNVQSYIEHTKCCSISFITIDGRLSRKLVWMDKLKRGDFQTSYLCNSNTRIQDVRDVLILLCFWIRKIFSICLWLWSIRHISKWVMLFTFLPSSEWHLPQHKLSLLSILNLQMSYICYCWSWFMF